MAKFIFRLQTVLNIKEQLEKNLKNELGRAHKKLDLEKQTLFQIQKEQDIWARKMNLAGKEGVIVDKIREYNAYIMVLRKRSLKQKEKVIKAQENVDKFREQLVKAVQEREILDKLKEKQYEEYMKTFLIEEQKLNDEITGYKYYAGIAGE